MTHIVSCCSSIVTYDNFLSMAYIFTQSHKKWKNFPLLCIFYDHASAMLCFLNNILIFFLAVFYTLVQLLNLFIEIKILIFVNTNGRPDVLTRKVLNENLI